jgi:hypothetical protein
MNAIAKPKKAANRSKSGVNATRCGLRDTGETVETTIRAASSQATHVDNILNRGIHLKRNPEQDGLLKHLRRPDSRQSGIAKSDFGKSGRARSGHARKTNGQAAATKTIKAHPAGAMGRSSDSRIEFNKIQSAIMP